MISKKRFLDDVRIYLDRIARDSAGAERCIVDGDQAEASELRYGVDDDKERILSKVGRLIDKYNELYKQENRQ